MRKGKRAGASRKGTRTEDAAAASASESDEDYPVPPKKKATTEENSKPAAQQVSRLAFMQQQFLAVFGAVQEGLLSRQQAFRVCLLVLVSWFFFS